MPLVIVVLILAIALTPALLSWWELRQNNRCTLRSERRPRQTHRALRPVASRDQPVDLTYSPGVGYWIGDFSCCYNARSAYLRCAVNPTGPCQTCHLYKSLNLDG
jgi:Family of unknown function (DUF6464)